jgi:hypothetical protein
LSSESGSIWWCFLYMFWLHMVFYFYHLCDRVERFMLLLESSWCICMNPGSNRGKFMIFPTLLFFLRVACIEQPCTHTKLFSCWRLK